jgi:hypothetical protein
MPAALRATAALAILAAGAAAACTPWGATGAATRQRAVGLRLRGGSSQLAAYLLCRMGGNDAPSLDDVKGALESIGAKVRRPRGRAVGRWGVTTAMPGPALPGTGAQGACPPLTPPPRCVRLAGGGGQDQHNHQRFGGQGRNCNQRNDCRVCFPFFLPIAHCRARCGL